MSIGEAFELYRSEVLVLKGQSPRTEEALLVSMKVVSGYFSNKPIAELTVDDVRDWHRSMSSLSVNTIRGYLFCLRNVLRHIRSSGHQVLNPDLVIIPKRVQTVPDYLKPKEIDLILKSIKVRRGCRQSTVLRDKAIISMLYGSGMRASELCSLNKKNWEDRKATIIGKGGKPRPIYWDARTHKLLKAYLKCRTDSSPAMFVSASGERLKRHALVVLFLRLQKLCKIPYLHAHTLRHSYATNLMSNGMHIYTISRLMGHSSIQTTAKYLHIDDLHLKEEYSKYHSI